MSAKLCVICGRLLAGRRKVYCCDICAAEGNRRRERSGSETREHVPPFRDHVCPDCGRSYHGHVKSKRCPECQARADALHNRQYAIRQERGLVRHIGSRDLCKACGKPYIVAGGRQRYCKDCAPEVVRNNIRAQNRETNRRIYGTPEGRVRRKELKKRIPIQRTCEVCGQSFEGGPGIAKYCSAECRKKAKAEYYHEYDARRAEKRSAAEKEKRKNMTQSQ